MIEINAKAETTNTPIHEQ